ncbi:MAG: TPM domain-containing protein [Paracoccus sp. (in: a-proteobacteria)]
MRHALFLCIALTLTALGLSPLGLSAPARAQSLPDWDYTSVNDFAGLLTNDDTMVIDQALIALHDATGVEGTVVTLNEQASHGGPSGMEDFATRLFNYWGVGDNRRNDGFMLLVLKDDREARIELGAGYPTSFDRVAGQIMDQIMVPAFRNGDYSGGLRSGTLAVIEKIARPQAAGQPAQMLSTPAQQRSRAQSDSSGSSDFFSIFFIFLPFGMFILVFSLIIRRGRTRPPGQASSAYYMDENGSLQRNPDYRESSYGSLHSSGSSRWSSGSSSSSSSSSSSGGFGGGSSRGGGASGRW